MGAPRSRLRSDDRPAAAPLLALPADERLADGRRARSSQGAPVPAGPRDRHLRRRSRHRRGEAGADGDRRLPARPGQVPPARRPDPSRSPPQRPARHRQDASRAGRRRARPGRRSSRCRRRSSSRRSSASAPRACATCSGRRSRSRRRSSLSTSSTRSAERAAVPAAVSAASDEREQTLNQILTEMDGFDSTTSVIVIGATNRIDVLDQALLRPGRFDRRVVVLPPDRDGRRLILEVHTREFRSRPTSTSTGSQLPPRAWSAPIWRTSSTRPRFSRRAQIAARCPRGLRASLEKIILGAERKIMLTAGRPSPHRVPRGRPRARRDAHAGRRSGAQGHDRPSRTGARCHPLVARRRQVQLLARRARGAGEDDARRSGRRGGRLRRPDDRRRGRHRPGDRARAPHGRPLGDERRRSGWSPSCRATARILGGHGLAADARARRRRSAAHGRGGVRARSSALLTAERSRLDALADALLERETLDQIDAYRIAGLGEPEPLPVD